MHRPGTRLLLNLAAITVVAILVAALFAARRTSTPTATSSGSALVLVPARLPSAAVDVAYRAQLTLTGNRTPVETMWVSEGRLPAGLTFHFESRTATVTIAGIPTKAGKASFSISATCLGTQQTGQHVEQAYAVTVATR